MAQNYMMGAGMVPPTAPTPPSQLSFKSDPNQRMQFKSFMQGLSAPQAPMAPPMAPQMMPMPQIPIPMQNIDVFSQPVQNMAMGGRASRPQDRARRAEEGRAVAKRIFSRPENDDDKEDRARRTVKITPQQEAAARAALVDAAKTRAGSEDSSDYGQFVASARNRYRRPSSLSDQVAALSSVPADFGAEFGDDRRRSDSLVAGIASTQTPADIINQSIQERLGLESGLTNVDSMPMVEPVYDRISELDVEDAALIDPLGVSPLSRPMEPNFLSRLPFGLGEYFLKGQVQDLQEFVDIPGAEYDYSARSGSAPAGQGTLNISPSGVVTYTGRRDPNYTGSFANLVNPQVRSEREVNPCPPGYTLINGACMPISQPIAQATPATPAPNVISNIPITTAAPSPVVQSTAPPVQLGMPLGQPTPIQPMNRFLTNIPNSLNLAANNFLSSLSS